ncbi:hypothetical protein [Pseudarthrobacter siccitolerans]
MPLDIFDPSEDGFAPHTLGEVVEAGREAIDALARLERALKGCMAPLNLTKVIAEVQQLGPALPGIVEELSKARHVIEYDRPVARSLSFHDKPWSDPEYNLGCLSPKQLLLARSRVREVMPSEMTTYRDAVKNSGEAVPTFIYRHRRAGEKTSRAKEQRETKETLLQELLEDMLARPCSKCGAPSSGYCVTATGNRADVLHAARRDASPRMLEHRSLFSQVRQPPEFEPDPDYYRKNPGHPSRRDFSEEKKNVDEVVETLAQSFTPRYE